MITHAYVRYEDDKRCAIVEVTDIKGFNPKDDFECAFYSTKWTDDSGASDYYRSRILLVADSEQRLRDKIKGRRVRIKRLPTSESDTDDDIAVQAPKKKDAPRQDLLDILAKKKKTLSQTSGPKNNAASYEELVKAKEEIAHLHQEVAKQGQDLEELQPLKKEVSHLRQKVVKQRQELDELRLLNRNLQWRLVGEDATGGPSTTLSSPKRPLEPPPSLLCRSPVAPIEQCLSPVAPLEHAQEPKPTVSESKVDIGKGLLIPRGAWQRIESREKDSLFVKDLLVTIWDPAVLKSRSLNGKHCPRFPDRPKKKALTPWKVAVIRDCFKQRLQKRSVPPELLPTLLKQVNHFLVEKIADVERTARKLEMSDASRTPEED